MPSTGFDNRNCSDEYLSGNTAHYHIQNVLLSFGLIYILFLNGLAIGLTIYMRRVLTCWISRQLISSYIGNILGGVSLIGNYLSTGSSGIPPPGCVFGKDKFFFLYVGISINMIIILCNTYLRYRGIVCQRNVGEYMNYRQTIKRIALPAWLAAVVVATIASIIEHYVMAYTFIIVVAICAIPLFVSIIWNFSLSQFLVFSSASTRASGRHQSMRTLKHARAIIYATIACHTLFLIIGAAITLLLRYYAQIEMLVVITVWIIRFIYFILFTIGAKVFLLKTPQVRIALKLIVMRKTCCVELPQEDEREIEIEDLPDSLE